MPLHSSSQSASVFVMDDSECNALDGGVARGQGCGPQQAALARDGKQVKNVKKNIHMKNQIVSVCVQ